MSSNRLLYGDDAPLPPRVEVRAGPLSAVFEGGDLRGIAFAGREVVRRIYGAVRDREWATVLPALSDVSIKAGGDSFAIHYRAHHRAGEIDFVWKATIHGNADGSIVFGFDGLARSAFYKNRVGLCVLHPMRECAGLPVERRGTRGESSDIRFPALVSIEQPITGLSNLAGMSYEAGPQARIELSFAGDTFETEDQRNWIDASFKTYSTPIAAPRPVLVPAGTRIEQQVTVRLVAEPPGTRAASTPVAKPETVTIECTGEARAMPSIGVMLPPDTDLVRANAYVQAVRPAHIRVDLDMLGHDGSWRARFDDGLTVARSVGCALELALDVSSDSATALDELATLLSPSVTVARILILSKTEPSTSTQALALVRDRLTRQQPHLTTFGAGTRMDLYQLHLFPHAQSDLICWSMNPQAHASDITSLAETPPAAGEQVRTVLTRHPRAKVAITPVTLGPRSLTGTAEFDAHPLYASQFAAAWTLSMLKHLAEAGAHSVTIFDVPGGDAGEVAPVRSVLAALCATKGGTLFPTSTNVEGIESLLVGAQGVLTLHVANLSREVRIVEPPAQVSGDHPQWSAERVVLAPFATASVRAAS